MILPTHISKVVFPPTWRETPLEISYLILDEEPKGSEIVELCQWALDEKIPNPRIIWPFIVEWSYLFHPLFFQSVLKEKTFKKAVLSPSRFGQSSHFVTRSNLTQFWLESMLFLGSVTLSAAVIQSRWSSGTMGSKYDRLWQAGVLASVGMVPELASCDLKGAVQSLVKDSALASVERLIVLRRLFENAMSKLSSKISANRVIMKCLGHSSEIKSKFGFLQTLIKSTKDLAAVVVYGSSVTGNLFADYDVILVVKDPEYVLRKLAGTCPSWRGKDLNISVYSPEEIWRMQLLSGDNLADYGLCLYGEVELPEKPIDLLLLRNLSFGLIRMRQQLGMVSSALSLPSVDDDKRNLYEYFVKIPANVAKGTFGSVGQKRSKEDIYRWVQEKCNFDTRACQLQALNGNSCAALAAASIASGSVLRALNTELQIVTYTGQQENTYAY